jgi:hypothetical protein
MISSSIYSQFGARVKYNLNTFSSFDEYIDQNTTGNNEKIFASNTGIGLDYWFRLKNYRVEFLPEIHLGLKTSNTYDIRATMTDFSSFGFNFNTQIYLFDLEGDCDCPTFSKQGPSLSKGLFFNFSPGVLYYTTAISNAVIDPTITNSEVAFKLGLGIGYDVGISDLFTITPMFNYNIAPGIQYDELEIIGSTPPEPTVIDSGLNQLQFQIRFGFRPDYVKSYGRR